VAFGIIRGGAGGGGSLVVKLNGILESAVYADDMERARRFYEEVMGLKPMFTDSRLTAYDAGARSVLLLFKRGASVETVTTPRGTIPGHDGSGALHLAFAIDADELAAWEERLKVRGVEIEGRMDWPRGGTSIYFRDPDGHLIELATPGLWPVY
jgi:catechol 2,3-dioxygenase-like lactoylglutathione lyase family enzyme